MINQLTGQSITNHRLPWQLFTQYSLDSDWLALLLDFVMADRMLLRAIKGQAKNLNLSNKGLENLPALIGKVTSLQILTLKGNKLQNLPRELVVLRQVCIIRSFGPKKLGKQMSLVLHA